MLQWSGPAPPLSHRRRLVTNRGHAAHHMTLKSLHSHNIHVTPHFFLLARTTWVICLVRKTRERREVKGKMIGNCNIAIEKVSYLDLKYSYRKTWRGCLDHCCCHPPRQHSCGCSMKKKASPVREELSLQQPQWLHPTHYIKPPSHSRGGEKKPSRFRKKFLTGPPLSSSSPAPPLLLPPLWKFPLLHSARSVSFHCRSH